MKLTVRRIVTTACATVVTVGALAGTTPAYGDATVLGPPGPIVRGGSTVETWMGVRVDLSWAHQWLDRGNSWEFGHARLTLELNGNLVLRNRHNRWVRWTSNTPNRGVTQLLWQEDGNLVLYTAVPTANAVNWCRCWGSRAIRTW